MFDALKNHPFAVDAFFEHSLVLTFAVPKQQLQPLLPDCLVLDTFQDTHAFVAVALVQTKALRPKGFPAFLGNDFFLIGYRIFVRYTTVSGKNLRGLFILRSETDKRKMSFMGNLFSHYKYTTTDIAQVLDGTKLLISSQQSPFRIAVDAHAGPISLPHGSPFADWKEARRFAGPLPFTFTYVPEKKHIVIIQGLREDWTPLPVEVLDYDLPFLTSIGCANANLANAFIVRQIPYSWSKGKTEPWPR